MRGVMVPGSGGGQRAVGRERRHGGEIAKTEDLHDQAAGWPRCPGPTDETNRHSESNCLTGFEPASGSSDGVTT